ncbi:MAG: UbiA family prenyltransferase [Pseudomonadota bacterium]
MLCPRRAGECRPTVASPNDITIPAPSRWRLYYELTKPRVVALIVLTAVVGSLLATPGLPPLDLLLFGNLGIGLAAASAATLNQVLDQRIDAKMARTRLRPLPTGGLTESAALGFAAALGALSMLVLWLLVNPFSSAPAAAFAKPGSLNITQEPASSSLTRMFTEVPFRLDRELAARANVGFSVADHLMAIARDESGARRRRCAPDAAPTRSNCKGRLPATTPACKASTANVDAADITRAHRGVPGGLTSQPSMRSAPELLLTM